MSNWFSPSISQCEKETQKIQDENKLKRKSKSEEKIKIKKAKKADKSIKPKEIKGSWLKAFEPKSVGDLLLHPKKLEDLRNWFRLTLEAARNRILLLTGPTGCLKASSARLLAKEAGYDVIEYVTSQRIESELTNVENRFETHPRQSTEFADFLLRSSVYQNVFTKKERVIIVKDFPNVFLRKGNEEDFFNVLRSYKQNAVSPLIFILTETQSKSANIEYRLFPDALRTELLIENISMNPITTTNMKRALKLICASLKDSAEKPSDEIIESVVAQSQGDIRNAVNNLQLMSQQGNVEYVVKKRAKKVGKTEKAVPQAKITKGVGKDELLDIFHGVGRALYPKWEDSRLTHRPEDLADTFSTQPANFIELVHSNYIKKFSNLEDVCEMSEILSVSDKFQTEYRDAENLQLLNLGMVVRGAMVLNSEVTSGFQPISAYAIKKHRANEQKYLQKYEKFENKLGSVHVTKKDFFCDYSMVVK